jgi:hypothetical protein
MDLRRRAIDAQPAAPPLSANGYSMTLSAVVCGLREGRGDLPDLRSASARPGGSCPARVLLNTGNEVLLLFYVAYRQGRAGCCGRVRPMCREWRTNTGFCGAARSTCAAHDPAAVKYLGPAAARPAAAHEHPPFPLPADVPAVQLPSDIPAVQLPSAIPPSRCPPTFQPDSFDRLGGRGLNQVDSASA